MGILDKAIEDLRKNATRERTVVADLYFGYVFSRKKQYKCWTIGFNRDDLKGSALVPGGWVRAYPPLNYGKTVVLTPLPKAPQTLRGGEGHHTDKSTGEYKLEDAATVRVQVTHSKALAPDELEIIANCLNVPVNQLTQASATQVGTCDVELLSITRKALREAGMDMDTLPLIDAPKLGIAVVHLPIGLAVRNYTPRPAATCTPQQTAKANGGAGPYQDGPLMVRLEALHGPCLGTLIRRADGIEVLQFEDGYQLPAV